jgi:hypothetical protein
LTLRGRTRTTLAPNGIAARIVLAMLASRGISIGATNTVVVSW